MTVPVVVAPNPRALLLELLRGHEQLPPTLVGKVVATLPDEFPAGLPYLQVRKAPGGQTLVPQRLWTANFDLHLFHVDEAEADDLARFVVAVARSLEQRAGTGGGFTAVEVGDPFPLPDPSTAERVLIPVAVTYRPRKS